MLCISTKEGEQMLEEIRTDDPIKKTRILRHNQVYKEE